MKLFMTSQNHFMIDGASEALVHSTIKPRVKSCSWLKTGLNR